MTKAGVDIVVISIVMGGVAFVVLFYVGWQLDKIQKKLKDLAEALQKLGKSPKKKGGN